MSGKVESSADGGFEQLPPVSANRVAAVRIDCIAIRFIVIVVTE